MTIHDRLLAEAVRAYERTAGAIRDDAAAARAIRAGGDLEQRVIERAKHVAVADDLRQALNRIHRLIGLAAMVGAVLALLAGAATAGACLGAGRGEPVNIAQALAAALGLQTLMLVVWVGVILFKPRSAGAGALGAIVVAAGRAVAARLARSSINSAAVRGWTGVMMTAPRVTWMLSAVSHGLWTAFNIGLLAIILLLLSTRHYTFALETTILPNAAYEQIVPRLAALPRAVGFEGPMREQIQRSQWPGDAAALEESREEWSGFLIGALIVYGLAPRLLLLLVSVLSHRSALGRFRLDSSNPEYIRLRPALMPDEQRLGVVDGDFEVATAVSTHAIRDDRPLGPPVIFGLEIARPRIGWPPSAAQFDWNDLGFVDDGETRRDVLRTLHEASHQPRAAVAVVDLTTTPDRGLGVFLSQMNEAAGGSGALILSGGQALRQRATTDMSARVGDWRRLGIDAGIPEARIIELDLEHATDASLARLASIAGAASAAQPAKTDRFAQAFSIITRHAEKWSGLPTIAAEADLHREFAGLYRNEFALWRERFNADGLLQGDVRKTLQAAAQTVSAKLPDQLRLRPAWLAAGAAAGALGCIAAAAMVFPGAIASLPLWSSAGAAAGQILAQLRKRPPDVDTHDNDEIVDLGDPVRAAAMLAMLLELQGRDESEISRVLSNVAGDQRDGPIRPDEVKAWLSGLHARFIGALRRELNS